MTRNSKIPPVLLTLGALTSLDGCVSDFTLAFVDQFAVRVLPPESGGSRYELNPGDSTSVRVEIQMGTNLRGTGVTVTVGLLPDGLSLPGFASPPRFLDDLESDESVIVTYTVTADGDARPGIYEFTVSVSMMVRTAGSSGSDFESATISVTVLDPNAQSGDGPAACAAYVAFYNALPCIADPLDATITCSESISENCTGEAAFNTCRMGNTSCENGELIENLDACSDLLICGLAGRLVRSETARP